MRFPLRSTRATTRLSARAITCSPVPQNTARTEKAIPLDFKRLMSLLDFVLLPGTGYDDVDGILAAEVQVMNMAQVANVDFVTGEVSSPAIKANITPHGSFRASDGKAVGVEAIVPPQHVDARSYLFNVRIGERNFRCTTDKELTFEAGRRYTFTLTINRAAAGGEVALSPTIEDWTPGTASSEETVEVDPDLDVKVVRDIDGNEYAIVRIGTQQWTGANLRTTHYNDGTPITLLEDQEAWAQCENSEEAAYCLYDNDATNSELYGMLYNWHAANTGKLCPEGWHIPSVEEWKTLSDYLGSNAGAMLKSTSGWSDTWGESKPEYQGTDDYGFTALPAAPANGTSSRLSVRKGHGGRPTPFLTIHCRLPTPVWMPPTRFFRPAVHGARRRDVRFAVSKIKR